MSQTSSDDEFDFEDKAPLLSEGRIQAEERESITPEPSPPKRQQNRLSWIIAIGALLAAASIPLSLLGGFNLNHDPEACQTPECLDAAAYIKQNLAPNWKELDACTDFLSFNCGGWNSHHDPTSDSAESQTKTFMSERAYDILRTSFESIGDRNEQRIHHDYTVKAADAYKACVNEDRVVKQGVRPLLDLLSEVQRRFYANLDRSSSKSRLVDAQLTEVLIYLLQLDMSPLFSISLEIDKHEHNSTAVYIDPPSFIGMPSAQFYASERYSSNYTRTIRQVFDGLSSVLIPGLISVDLSAAGIAPRIVSFESQLAQLTIPTRSTYHTLSIEDVGAMMKFVRFSKVLSRMQSSQGAIRINTYAETYFAGLASLLESTDLDVIHGYLLWKAVQKYHMFIDHDAMKPVQYLRAWFNGQYSYQPEPRWQDCIRYVDNSLEWLTSILYSRLIDQKDRTDFATMITSTIINALVTRLESAQWMQSSVLEMARTKLKQLSINAGIPTLASTDLPLPEAVQNYYKDLAICNGDHFANALTLARHRVEKAWSLKSAAAQRDSWIRPVTFSNALYRHSFNDISVPLTLLKKPAFFGSKVPSYLTYGAFGALVGHELTHAIDYQGSFHDADGSLTSWWNETTEAIFKDRSNCFINQYNQYSFIDPNNQTIHLDAKISLIDNIADANGINAAFDAWKSEEKHRPQANLPGLSEFTKE